MVLSLCLCLLPAWSQEAAPTTEEQPAPDLSWMEEVPFPTPGEVAPLAPCRLNYSISWSKFLEMGNASISLSPQIDRRRLDQTLGFLQSTTIKNMPDNLIAGRATGSTTGLGRFTWRYDCDILSVIDPVRLRPKALHFHEAGKSGQTDFYGEFSKTRFRSYRDKNRESEEGKKPRSLTYSGLPAPLDLLSAILYLRSLPLEVGDETKLVVCPNEHPYLIKVKVEAHEEHVAKDGTHDAIRLAIGMKKIRKTLELEPHEKFKKATVWLAKGGHRLPIEIRAEIFVGSVRVVLKDYQELKPLPTP